MCMVQEHRNVGMAVLNIREMSQVHMLQDGGWYHAVIMKMLTAY